MKTQIALRMCCLSFFLLIASKSPSQNNPFHDDIVYHCDRPDEILHGNGHIHVENCDEEILISSTPHEDENGSIISGIIDSNIRVRITPGVTGVRLKPEDYHNIDGDAKHRTRLNGGAGGGFQSNSFSEDTLSSISLTNNSNTSAIALVSDHSKIVRYQVFNLNGNIKLEKKFDAPELNASVYLQDLEQGVYFIKSYLKSGEIINKKIFKH